MIAIYQKNLINSFFKSLGIVTVIFFCITIILNIFEEVSFFKNVEDVNFTLPIFLTILNSPSILFDIFPFIFLLSSQFLFYDLFKKNELNLFKVNGLSNFRIIKILFYVSLIMGIFTFPILFYAGLFFYVVQNYMFAFMKRI